jgi:hypothetical protein
VKFVAERFLATYIPPFGGRAMAGMLNCHALNRGCTRINADRQMTTAFFAFICVDLRLHCFFVE